MPSNILYLIGFVIVIIGLSYGAYLAGISAEWITVGIIVLFGIAILKIAKRGRNSKPFDTA
jgi:hypothetical protein